MSNLLRSYEELIKIPTWEERFIYLSIGDGKVGEETFGGYRRLNQMLYSCPEWKHLRREILIRDMGCDMAHKDYPIPNGIKVMIHHINPITPEDIIQQRSNVFDMNNLVCVSFNTHEFIHYGSIPESAIRLNGNRSEGDTKLW